MASVLVVDDAMFMRVVLRSILERAGHSVVGEAADGAEAVRRYAELHPDVVTIDLAMPGVDGVAAIERITEMDPDARIVVCTAMGQMGVLSRAIQAGARDLVLKPIRPERVLEAIERVLAPTGTGGAEQG